MASNLPRIGRTRAYIVIAMLLFGMLPTTILPVKGGTLSLVKGSWDVIGLDHNNVLDGPNQYVIQIHITNTAGVTALSVSGTLTWDTANTYVNLGPNESFTKSIGDIAPGATVDLFYLIEVTRDSNAYTTTRDYTITISGTNTGTPDTITGQLLVERLRSQARNEVASMVASTTTPSVGDTFTITVNSLTGAKNYNVVNLPISEYNPLVIEPVSVTCTWVEPPAPPQTSSNVRLDLPGDDDFTSVWTFRAVAPGTSGATSFITDQSGGSYHYNADYPDGVTITVRGVADLRLEKTVDDSTPNVGDNVTFTITVYNDGPNDAHNVAVEDILPAGLNYVSDTPSQGSYDNVSGIWTVGTITNGGSATLQITAQVTASGSIKNVAQVYASDESDPDSVPNNDDGDQSEDDEDSETLTVAQAADVRMEKTVNDSTPNVGDTVTFTITVYNDGPDTATNITVADVIPTGYTYVPASITGGDSRNDSGLPTLTWTINSLTSGSNTVLTFQAVVLATGNYKNVAQVTASDQYDPDSTPNNDDGDQSEDDEDFATATPQQADLRMEKTVNDPTPNVGDTVTFTITVYNDGPDTATNVQITDVVPSGFTYVAGTMTGGDVRNEAGAPTLVWTINSLAGSSNTVLTFQAVVQASGDYKNVAQVTASDQYDPDSTPNNDDGDQSEDDEDSATATPQMADLRMEKTVNDPTPNVGDTVTFTITVYNDGPDTATNITVADVIPTGYTYVPASITGGDSRNDGGLPTLTWTINSLTSGSNTVLTFQAVVLATGNYKNVAQVTASDQYDPDSTPNNDDGDQSEDDEDFATAAPQMADLSLTKVASDPTPNVGDTITFTITVTNGGPNAATNVQITDIVPNGYTYVAGTMTGGDVRNEAGAPTLVWTINNLAVGSTNLTFQAVVLATGNYKNVAQVTASDQYDPDSTPNNDDGDQSEDDEDFATAAPQMADLSLTKVASDPTPNVGDTITFTITVTNGGPNAATNVQVRDVVPNGYTYVAGTMTGGDVRNEAGAPTLVWTINSLAVGSTNLTFQAVVLATGNYKNVAQVTASDQYDPDSVPNNDDGDQSEDDEDSATTTPQQADLSLTKVASDPTPNVGDTITFTITVTNGGPSAATNVQITDVVPSGFTYVAGTMTGGDVRNEAGAPTLVWTINSLAVGSTNLTFQAVVLATGNYKNVAQVTASDQYDPDSTPNNDDGDQSEDDEDFATAAPSQADLRLTKNVSNPNPNVGDTLTFTITVYNDGPNAATNVQITDVVPSGFTYVAGTMTGGDVRNEAGAPTLVWTINNLAVGSTNLTFQAVVLATGNYKNVAQVTASDQYDPDSTPNNDDGDQSEDDEDSSTATPYRADLRMTKTVNDPTPNVGDTVTFTITVYNDGPDTATNITVADVIPNGYTYVPASITGGDSRNDSGLPTLTWTINSLTSGSNTVLTFQAVVQATGNYKNVAQVTASDQYDPDSTPNNDDGDQSEDDEDSATATPQQADLRMTKTVNDPTPNVGDTVTFTITVYNDGPDAATNVQITDVIQSGFTYVPASITGGDSRNDSGAPTLTWTINNLTSGSNTVLTFQAVVQASGNYRNVAQVTASDQPDPDSTPNNDDGDQSEDDEDSTTATPQRADLRMLKTVSNPAPSIGDTITFIITVYNDGPDIATNITVADVIPNGYTYVPASITGGDSRNDSGAPTLTWTINSLTSGSNTLLTFQAVVLATGNYRNIAQVTASDQHDPDSTPNNDDGDQSEDDEDSETIAPGGVPIADITILKSASPSMASPGTLVLFTLVITNTGGVLLDPVEVIDDLSPGLTYADAANIPPDTTTPNPDGSTTLIWFSVGPLNPGESITLSFYVIFNGSESSACNKAAAVGVTPDESQVSDGATACVQLPQGTTPYEPNASLQPLAYNRMIDCYTPFKDLIDRIRSSGVEVSWDRQRPCCENLHNLIEQLLSMVVEKGLDKEYPEKWARVQELLPFVDECCRNLEDYYNAGNYVASNYWGLRRDEAYREIIEILLEMLGF